MSDFGEGKYVKARWRHRCVACWWPIEKGELHYNYRGMYGGEWQNWRMHVECEEDWEINGCEEFTPGDFEPPERLVIARREAEDARKVKS